MSVLTNNNIAQAIYASTKNKTKEEQSLIAKNAVKFLVKRRLMSKSGDILLRLEKIINEHEGRIVAKVWSKEKLNENTNRQIVKMVAIRYEGKEIILDEQIDEKLLGGFKIEINDEVIDLTFKNKVEKLKEYLIKTS